MDADDLRVISALVQDAVIPVTEISWRPSRRQFALLINRFRWEDVPAAEQRDRPFERVQSVLSFSDVEAVATQGVDRSERDLVLSLLALEFEPLEDGRGYVLLTLAGDGAIRLSVEALDVILRDVTRPYKAPSGHRPGHGE
ncbi:MAG: DUF2948 family protein [Sphingomonadaceae bacterium]|nr:MAG: DUF2948 family protein [Sphingomonadaceae bacterium]